MQELNAGKYFGSEVRNRNIGGIWTSLARYDETLRLSPKNLSNDWHVHENPHFSFILEGGNVERRQTTRDECLPGQVLFYQAGEPHQNLNVVYPSKNFNVEIDGDFLAKYDLKEPKINSDFVAGSDIKFTLLRIYKETVNKDDTNELAVHSLILGVLSEKEKVATKTSQIPRWADKVFQILRDRWDENLSLLELSEASGVHPVTISRNFPKYFFCTLGEYVRRVRIEKSLALIKQSDNSLTDIAYRCGFADQSHFTRVFRHLTGLKPGTFKRI
jgi:AraC family transcriptional regulator